MYFLGSHLCQKYVKKGYMEITTKIYLETLKSVPGIEVAVGQ